MGRALLEFRSVTKRFGDKTVLDNVNVKMYENQITTIIGKSGTRTSVLLKHIIGLLTPDEGTILFRGEPLHTIKKSEGEYYRSQVACLFQNNALFDSMTVCENVALSREAFRVHYLGVLGGRAATSAVSAALLSVEFAALQEALGPQAAVEAVRALGNYTNKRFNAVGGFSARHSRDQIPTIFPHTMPDKARQLVAGFAEELKQEALTRMQSISRAKAGTSPCYEIRLRAGITGVSPTDEIEQIIEKARAKEEIIATHRCDPGGSVQ